MQIAVEKMFAYVFWIIVMSILYYELDVIIRSISFFVISNSSITRIEEAGLELCMQLTRAIYGIMVVAVFNITICISWKRGIRHYNSASS